MEEFDEKQLQDRDEEIKLVIVLLKEKWMGQFFKKEIRIVSIF